MTKMEFIDKQIDRISLSAIVALTLLAAFIVFGLLIFLHQVPDGNDKNITLVLMAFSGAVGAVVQWLYGSSQNSAKRNDAMIKAGMVNGMDPLPPVNNLIVNSPKE